MNPNLTAETYDLKSICSPEYKLLFHLNQSSGNLGRAILAYVLGVQTEDTDFASMNLYNSMTEADHEETAWSSDGGRHFGSSLVCPIPSESMGMEFVEDENYEHLDNVVVHLNLGLDKVVVRLSRKITPEEMEIVRSRCERFQDAYNKVNDRDSGPGESLENFEFIDILQFKLSAEVI